MPVRRPLPIRHALVASTLLMTTLVSGGCGPHRILHPTPPLVLERPAPAIPLEACAPRVEPGVPGGHTPLPTAQGELALLDVRGDDRLGFAGPFVATWTSDGEHLVTATATSVLTWNPRTGELERSVDLERTPGSRLLPSHVAVSPDGAWIGVSAYVRGPGDQEGGGTWVLRATGSGPARRLTPHAGEFRFSPDSRQLLQGDAWELATGVHTRTAPLPGTTLPLPDGRRALVLVESAASPDRRYVPELRDLATGATLRRFPPVEGEHRVALSGDGSRVAVLDSVLSIYATATFERVAQVSDVERAGMVHLSHDGRRAVIETLRCVELLGGNLSAPRERVGDGCAPPALAVWDLDRSERLLRTTHGAGDGWVFSRDGAYLTGRYGRRVEEIIRVKDGARLRFGSSIRSISPDSRWVLFDEKSGAELASLDGSVAPPALTRAPRVLARSADGRFLASTDGEDDLRLEGPGSCTRLGVGRLDRESAQVSFSPDSASLLTLTRPTSQGVSFRAFRTSDGVERWSTRSTGASHASILTSAGQVLFQGEGRFEVQRFDAVTGAALPTGRAPGLGDEFWRGTAEVVDVRDPDGKRPGTGVSSAATHDGRTLAAVSYLGHSYQLSLWDPLSPRDAVDVPMNSEVRRLSLSPDERVWAGVLGDGTIRLLARDGSRPLTAAALHTGSLTSMIFTRSGDRLLTADESGQVFVTDTSSGAVVGQARLPLDHATHLWLAPDGREVWADTARSQRVRFRLSR